MVFPTYLADYDPESAEKVTNIENNDGQFNDLENLARHNLACDYHDVRMDVVGLAGVILNDSVYVPFYIVFVHFHELLYFKHFGTLEHSYNFHEVEMDFCSFYEFEILRSRDQRDDVQDELILKITGGYPL
mgnify:CR=1 FL=1